MCTELGLYLSLKLFLGHFRMIVDHDEPMIVDFIQRLKLKSTFNFTMDTEQSGANVY